MRGEEHDALEPLPGEALAVVLEQCDEGLDPKRERAREVHVMLGEAGSKRRGDEGIAGDSRGALGDRGAEVRVGPRGKVRAVLLRRTAGEDRRRPSAGQRGFDLGPGHLLHQDGVCHFVPPVVELSDCGHDRPRHRPAAAGGASRAARESNGKAARGEARLLERGGFPRPRSRRSGRQPGSGPPATATSVPTAPARAASGRRRGGGRGADRRDGEDARLPPLGEGERERDRRAEDRADRGRAGAVEERARVRGSRAARRTSGRRRARRRTTARTRSPPRAGRRRGRRRRSRRPRPCARPARA